MASLSCVATGALTATFCSSYHDFSSRAFAPRVSAVPAAVRLARLVWNGQKSRKRAEGSVSLNVVAETAVVEEETPAVMTESVPRPKKVGKGVVRLRMTRLGRKKRPFFRIVATHHSRQRDGKYIELLGHYNPLHAEDDLGVVVKADRIKYWLGVGAQPSDTVTGILYKVGILKKVEGENHY